MANFTTGNSLVIPQMSASSIPVAQAVLKVYLNIYDLHAYNTYLSPLGTGFYHSGITFFNDTSKGQTKLK